MGEGDTVTIVPLSMYPSARSRATIVNRCRPLTSLQRRRNSARTRPVGSAGQLKNRTWASAVPIPGPGWERDCQLHMPCHGPYAYPISHIIHIHAGAMAAPELEPSLAYNIHTSSIYLASRPAGSRRGRGRGARRQAEGGHGVWVRD